MSTSPESEFDLEKLFLPAWAQEPSNVNKYAKFKGDDRPERKFDDRPGARRGPPRRDFSGPRPSGGDRPPRQDRPPQFGGRGPAPDRRDFRGPERSDRFERREPVAPLPEIDLTLLPDEKGVESLAHQIKITGRAYPLFDIARLILQKPERHQIKFEVVKRADGKIAQLLFLCALDDSLWLTENEAVAHVLARHFATFYQPEKTQVDPPKGTYTFVAQCGMSGAILGPPNYHDYQSQLRKLHTQRFARMPFEEFKARVKIVRDETVVKKWIEDQSSTTEYSCLNVPEAKRLPNLAEVEKHFREVHLATIIKQVESHTLSGPTAQALRAPALLRAVRSACEDQRRFPLRLATTLSQQFAGHGLQFFKVNKTITHVSVARPHFLDLEATPVSEGVRRIVDFINTNPKATRRKLMEALAPTPAPAEGAPKDAVVESTPEQNAVGGDLHWLIHQGHVIEFASGILETAKKPLPRPPKPERKTPAKTETDAAESTESKPTSEDLAAEAAQLPPPAPEITEPANSNGETAQAVVEPEPSAPISVSSEDEAAASSTGTK